LGGQDGGHGRKEWEDEKGKREPRWPSSESVRWGAWKEKGNNCAGEPKSGGGRRIWGGCGGGWEKGCRGVRGCLKGGRLGKGVINFPFNVRVSWVCQGDGDLCKRRVKRKKGEIKEDRV